MMRVVEFDLLTRRERNQHVASIGGRMALRKREKTARETTCQVLRQLFEVPPLQVAENGTLVHNLFRVRMVRIAAATLDDDGPADALKNVRDGVADWLGVNDRSPVVRWEATQARADKARFGVSWQHVYRVRIEIEDRSPGLDREVILEEKDSAGRAAKSRVKRLANTAVRKAEKRERVLVYHADEAAGGASSAGRNRAEAAFAKLTSGPPVPSRGKATSRTKAAPDAGDEARPEALAECRECRARVGERCSRQGAERMPYGVHMSRARATGLRVSADARHSPAARSGAPRVIPAAALPDPRVFIAVPWAPTKAYHERRMDAAALAHRDGRCALRPTMTMVVPREHQAKHGVEIVMHLQKIRVGDSVYWLYSNKKGK